MDVITIFKHDDAYMKIYAETSILYELSEYFTFNVPNAKFTPAYRNKMWDGKIRLLNLMKQTLYLGLIDYVHRFAEERGYVIEFDNEADFADTNISDETVAKFLEYLQLPFSPRDYQLATFKNAVAKRRSLILSPTASGKSLVVYLLSRYFMPKGKVLIVVPTVSLVHQMASDFVEYGCDPDLIHGILGGSDKQSDCPIFVSTWQSIYKQPRQWFQQFNTVIGDEAHLFKAKSLTSIMDKMNNCQYRFGLTGTLDGTQTNRLVLEGLFGAVYKATTTAELIDQKHLADFKIKAITLDYDEESRKKAKSFDYQTEVSYLINSVPRNKFLSKLVTTLKGNTLLLFQNIDHGKTLHRMVQELLPDTKVFLVYGDVKGEDREEIRRYTEQNDDVIIVASYGTFSTGVNIKNLHNVILGSPSKSRVRVLQSIGRGLRKGATKQAAVWYDIADDLSWKSKKNYTLEHMVERLKMYDGEQFDYSMFSVKIRGE